MTPTPIFIFAIAGGESDHAWKRSHLPLARNGPLPPSPRHYIRCKCSIVESINPDQSRAIPIRPSLRTRDSARGTVCAAVRISERRVLNEGALVSAHNGSQPVHSGFIQRNVNVASIHARVSTRVHVRDRWSLPVRRPRKRERDRSVLAGRAYLQSKRLCLHLDRKMRPGQLEASRSRRNAARSIDRDDFGRIGRFVSLSANRNATTARCREFLFHRCSIRPKSQAREYPTRLPRSDLSGEAERSVSLFLSLSSSRFKWQFRMPAGRALFGYLMLIKQRCEKCV